MSFYRAKLIIFGCAITMLTGNAFAAEDGGKKAYVDMSEIFKNYYKTAKQQKSLKRQEEVYKEKAEELLGKKVIEFRDYLTQKSWNYEHNNQKEINLPESNVLQYLLEDETLITVRPSGTEPKLKLYYAVRADNKEKAEKKLKESVNRFTSKVKKIIDKL